MLLPCFSVSRVFWSTKDPRRRCVYTCRIVEVIPEVFSTPNVEPDVTVAHDMSHPSFDINLHIKYTTRRRADSSAAKSKGSASFSDDASRLTSTDDSRRYTSSSAFDTTISYGTPPAHSSAVSGNRRQSSVFTDERRRSSSARSEKLGRFRSADTSTTPGDNDSSVYTPPTSIWSTFDALTQLPAKPEVSEKPAATAPAVAPARTPADQHLLKMVERLNRAASINKTRSRSTSRERSLSREGQSTAIFML